jgi:hypothetical protein
VTHIVDDLILTARVAALDELKHMLSRINWPDLERCDAVAFVTLLRPVYERVLQEVRDGVPPVEPIPLKPVQGVAQRAAPQNNEPGSGPARTAVGSPSTR